MRSLPDFPDIPAFEVREPDLCSTSFVFNSPHSGRYYPKRFLSLSRLDSKAIRRSEDFFVDELFAGATAMGAPLMVANFPRAYLDVNREPYELDQRMFHEPLPAHANRHSVRVVGGLGTVPRIVSEGLNIYSGRIAYADAQARIDMIYRPYHDTLRGLLARSHRQYGHAVLIDCHSMPGSVRLGGDGLRPDFVLGDRFGTSSSRDLTEAIAATLRSLGYLVVTNKPYAGGFITEHYGRPTKGLHAVQIEVNRALYFDEVTQIKKPGFGALCDDMNYLMSVVLALPDVCFSQYSLAAE